MTDKIFVIGDENKINYEKDITFKALSSFPDVKTISYQELETSNRKPIQNAPVFLCFPYYLWDDIVEKGDELYGVGQYGKYIKNFTEYIEEITEKCFPNAKYVNHPSKIILERDKRKTKTIIAKHGIKIPIELEKSIDTLMEELERSNSIYIKPGYGVMGKGITYLSPNKWTTNYKYDGKVISNHDDDHEWKEIEITGDINFLEKLLNEDVIIERAIINPMINKFKFDLRGRIIFGETDETFVYGRATETSSITSISQGDAKRIGLDEIKKYVPQDKIDKALEIFKKSANILEINFAGADILFGGEDFEPVFLEINSFPGPAIPDILFPKLYSAIKENLCK